MQTFKLKDMKYLAKTTFLVLLFMVFSCESIVDDINENPNGVAIEDVDAQLFLTGAMLANTVAQGGHLNRIGAMYSGQLEGLAALYSNIYGFTLSTAESNTTWSRIYVGTIPNLRAVRQKAPNDQLAIGITKVIEAHAIGIPDPVFDDQTSVFNSMIALLDDAINDLNGATSRNFPQDIYYNGNKDKWIEAANTLKARYFLQLKEYPQALTAAQNGISADANSMKFQPVGDGGIIGSKNLFWQILEGARAGDIGTGDSYLMQILDPASAITRNNAKTNETARSGYYTIDPSGGAANSGIIEEYEPQNLVSFAENQLIMAECAGRNGGIAAGLPHLNALRSWLNTGGMVNANFSSMPLMYAAYDAADFAMGGMENADNLSPEKAFLREVIEERYVSGFGMYMPYNDARRLRATDAAIAVPYFLNNGPAPPYPERMPYADDELNANANAPAEDPGIFTKTAVNQ